MTRITGPITSLLSAYRGGDSTALEELFRVVCPDLRRIASNLLIKERRGHLLQPTGLVNEAFIRFCRANPVSYADRHVFFAAFVRHMRRVLTDYARKRLAQKRLEDPDYTKTEVGNPVWEEILDLDRALGELQVYEPLAAQIVFLKFYAGFSNDEAAAGLDVSPRTVNRSWEWARRFLRRNLIGANVRNVLPIDL